MGGNYQDTDHDSSAFGGPRDLGYVVNISGTTPVAEDFDAERQWVRDYWAALVEHAAAPAATSTS